MWVRFLYAGDMRLARVKEAAELAYVTDSMITYWVRTGRLHRYPLGTTKRQYQVDVDEVVRVSKTNKFQDNQDSNLISRTEAASLAYVGERMISYYVKMGYVTAHYVFGNSKHYLVDRNEILAQRELMPDRIKHTARLEELSRQAKEAPRDSRGFWAKRTGEVND